MRKAVSIIVIVAVLCLAYLLFGGYPSSPLRGRLKSVTVTKRSFAPALTNSAESGIEEKTARIEDRQSVAAIEASLKSVWNGFSANSMEGLPKYHMEVEYNDGKTQTFVFTRTDWGASGHTPVPFLKELEKNGL